MIDPDDGDVADLPADYDDSEPGAVPELFARRVGGANTAGDVLRAPDVGDSSSSASDPTDGKGK